MEIRVISPLVVEVDNEPYQLWNEYRYKRMAEADQKAITKCKTVILKAKNKQVYFLYQALT
jgi:hypothetical protein